MNFNVVVTDVFKKHVKSIAKKHSSLKSDLENLAIYDKSVKESIDDKELDELLALAGLA